VRRVGAVATIRSSAKDKAIHSPTGASFRTAVRSKGAIALPVLKDVAFPVACQTGKGLRVGEGPFQSGILLERAGENAQVT
jgi:hypothetical protein